MSIIERETIERLIDVRDITAAICEPNGYHNPDYERYTGYINDMTRELTTIEEQAEIIWTCAYLEKDRRLGHN